MHLTKYQVVPASGGWRVVSSLGRTRFDGQVFSWTEACRLKDRLAARQAEIYGVVEECPQASPTSSARELISDWPPARARRAKARPGLPSTH